MKEKGVSIMSQDTAPTVTAGEIHDKEKSQRLSSAVAAAAQTLAARQEERMMEGVVEILKDLENPQRDNVPELYRNAEHRGTTQVSSPTERAYARMPEEVRQWRNPDSDHWNAEWIRGRFYGDQARMLQAKTELDGLFPQLRANELYEGAPGADGAISDGSAGASVPRPLEMIVEIARDRVAKMRRFANVMTMTRQTHTIPTASALTAGMVGEGSTQTNSEPGIAEVQISAKKAQVVAIASKELLADAAVNLVSVLSSRAGGALGVLEDNQAFDLGDGTGNNIQKIVGTAYAETTAAFLGYVDVVAMYYGVAQEYRDRAEWLIAADVLQGLANVRDGQGRPFYQGITDAPTVVVDDRAQVGTILRRPVYQVPYTDGTLSFGEHSACYTLGNRQGIELEVSRDVNFLSDEIVWKWTERIGGQNVDQVAVQQCLGITDVTSA
jgi:HK97 family phage major capsid protein